MMNGRLFLFYVALLSMSLAFVSNGFAALTCAVTTGCTSPGDVTVFKISGTTNAHAELPSQTNYPNNVCCSGVSTLGNSCVGVFATALRLSDVTNAHVQKEGELPVYPEQACLSISSGSVTCDYSTDCASLGAGYACLASISGDTNAHVGDCTAYSTKVCCAESLPICNNNNACEVGETQDSCPDCKTNINLNPSTLFPGATTELTIDVKDGRYKKNDKIKFELLIDGITPWTICPIHNVVLDPISPPVGVQITSDDIHVNVKTSCKVPDNISIAKHTLKVNPTINP